MAKSLNQMRQAVTLGLADKSNIKAGIHRGIENNLFDYLEELEARIPKVKVVTLDSFALDRNYSVNTELPVGAIISGVMAMLVCKFPNNNFGKGDTVTAPTPYPTDLGRTSGQGIGVQFSNTSNGAIRVLVNDQLTIMSAYTAGTNVSTNTVAISGTQANNWSIKLIINYT